MSSDVIVALIGLGGSAIGSIIGIMVSSKLTQYRLEQLEKKVEAHNRVVERTYELERSRDVVFEDIKGINHRIDDLEDFHKPKTS
jgi:hypothetical protein